MGLFVDDQTNGSAASVHVDIVNSRFSLNGKRASDADGVRIDEGGPGSVSAMIQNSKFEGNGGDGFEIDERGGGQHIDDC